MGASREQDDPDLVEVFLCQSIPFHLTQSIVKRWAACSRA